MRKLKIDSIIKLNNELIEFDKQREFAKITLEWSENSQNWHYNTGNNTTNTNGYAIILENCHDRFAYIFHKFVFNHNRPFYLLNDIYDYLEEFEELINTKDNIIKFIQASK